MSTERVSDPIDTARRALNDAPIRAVDLALTAIGATRGHRSDPDTQAYLSVLAEGILRASTISFSETDDPLERMLSETACEDLACSCLLRLLVHDDDVFREDGRLRAAHKLFDRRLAARVYSKLSINLKDQSFEKRDALRSAVIGLELGIQSQVERAASLDDVALFRNNLSQFLNDPVTEAVVTPLLPAAVTRKTLLDVVSSVADVADADDHDLPEAAGAAVEQCTAVRSAVADSPYLTSFVGALATRLTALVRERLRDRGLADPARVTISARAKQYPFAHVGTPALLRLDLENHGPGKARDLVLSIEGCSALRFDDSERHVALMPKGERPIVFIGQVVQAAGSGDAILARVTWRNADDSSGDEEAIFNLSAQAVTVDWDELDFVDPYPLEAVTDPSRFVGREAILRNMVRVVVASQSPGSAQVVGQKRVGKTSIAHALMARVAALRPESFVFIFVSVGRVHRSHARRDGTTAWGTHCAGGDRDRHPLQRLERA